MTSVSAYSQNAHRVGLKVDYLTSASNSGGSAALHFFQVLGPPGKDGKPTKRLVLLVDRATYAADLQTAINRCVAISHIQVMVLFEEDLRPVRGAPNEYDVLISNCSSSDFVRLIGSVYKHNDPLNQIPAFELEENRPLGPKVYVRPSQVSQENGFSKAHSDEALRRVREDAAAEIASLREELRKEKQSKMSDIVDLQTRNNELQHSLQQTQLLLKMAKANNSTHVLPQTPAPPPPHHEPIPAFDLGPEEGPLPTYYHPATPPPIPSKEPPSVATTPAYHPKTRRTLVNIFANGRTGPF